jgi:hypothetical protein
MNIYTLLGTLRDAVYDDSGIASWCTTNYSQAHKVYIGIDPKAPPGEDDYPLVSLWPNGKTQGESATFNGHEITLVCGIRDASTRTITGKTRVTEYAGVSDIERFTSDCIDVIATNIPGGMFLDSAETRYMDIDLFPYFMSETILSINLPEYQGRDSFD